MIVRLNAFRTSQRQGRFTFRQTNDQRRVNGDGIFPTAAACNLGARGAARATTCAMRH